MKLLLRLIYFVLTYGLVFSTSRAGAADNSGEVLAPYRLLPVSVKEPVPLPKGVNHAAIGGHPSGSRSTSVPEPGSVGLIAILVVLLALQRKRDRRTA